MNKRAVVGAVAAASAAFFAFSPSSRLTELQQVVALN
jgi:hypothetical protein